MARIPLRRPKAVSVWVYFPPRLLRTRKNISESSWQLDEVTERYILKGLCVLGDQESIKDALKIINFADQFPDILSADRKRKRRRPAQK